MKIFSFVSQKIIVILGIYFILLTLSDGVSSIKGQNVTFQDLFTDTELESKAVDTNLPVGSISGSATVSQGIANYTIPIQLPAGTNNVVPSINIVYQSQGSDGHLGVGWTLAGLSAITRNIKSFYHDGTVGPATISPTDVFALDGVRLIATSGTYGAANTIYSKEIDDFSRVTSYGTSGTGPTYFKVETKAGVEMEYGNTTNSRFMAKNNTDVLLWKLNKIIYKDGNYIEYIYETVNDEIRIKEIKYTGNATISPPLLPFNTILFDYQLRSDNENFKNITYEADRPIALNSLMTKITINADGQVFKSYSFNYANNSVNIFLNEVIEIGSDGTSTLNSTIFKYGDQPTVLNTTYVGFSNSNGNDIMAGDFNGDGYSDILTANRIKLNNKIFHNSLSVYTKIPSDLGGGFTFKYNITLPYNGSINLGGSNFNFLASDFNGDGRDDIAVPLTSGSLYPFTFEYLKIYLNNYDANGSTQMNIQLPTNAFRSINVNKKFFVFGDFNGDGIRDALLILTGGYGYSTSKAYVWYGNSGASLFSEISISGNSQFSINNWETQNLNILDFDGDGKDELMITKGSYSEIFSLSNEIATSIKISGFPTEWHLMFFGDFNGDRKTDMLTRAALNDNNASWNIAKSTGKEWIESPFIWIPVPYAGVYPSIDETYQGDKVLISDFNGDGKSDIIHHRNLEVNIHYCKGNKFAFQREIVYQNQSSINVIGDFNGDGRSDFLNRENPTSASYIFFLNNLGQELLLKRIKNGEGHITQFTYNRMCEPGTHYSKGLSTSPYNSVSYPFYSTSFPMYLVTRLDKEGLAETTYNYYDGILHRKGKGFLGFRRITESGPVNGATVKGNNDGSRTYSGPKRYNHKQHNYFNLNTEFAMLVLDSVVNLKGPERLNKKTITNQITQQNSGSLQKIFWHKTPTVKDDNIFENTVTEAINNIYDSDGNVENSVIVRSSKSGQALTEVERITTVTQYGIYGSFRKNVPIQITNTFLRSTQPSYSTITKYTYTVKGQLETQIDFFSKPKALTTTYSYNALGNIAGISLSSAGLTTRSSTNIYDPKGRYIESSTNAAGQVSGATYDARWAKPLTSIGVDGIKSKFEYDAFGRLTKTYFRKDLTNEFVTTVSYNWGSGGTSYYVESSHPGRPDVKTYFDNLGRKVMQETEGFEGYWIKETFLYDGNGNIIYHNGPHRPAANESSGLGTTSVFDDYGRLSVVTNSLRTIEYTYDYTNGQKKITQTLNLPVGQTDQVTSQTTDVSGKVISSTDASGTTTFTYFSHGKTKNVKIGNITYSSMLYDDYARQTTLTDINSGVTTYEYNAFGELIKENQPSNNNLTFTYNTLGNITSRSGTEGTTSYLYYTSGVRTNKLQKITSFLTGYEESYTYDLVYGRLLAKIEKINGVTYVTSHTYNKYDDLATTTYPSNVVITNEYDANGYLTNVKYGSITLFNNQGMTSYNAYKKYQYGNGLITDVSYNFSIPTRFYAHNSTESIKSQDLTLNWNYGTGNLTSRVDALVNKTETFQYDNMNRLTFAQVGSNTGLTMNYSTDGNMTVKTDAAGTNGLEYLNAKINAVSKVQNPITIPIINQQDIIYSVYQRPTKITEGAKTLDMVYSFDYERRMGTFKTNGVTDETRVYIGNYEKQTIGSVTKEIHYITNGERLIAMLVREGGVVNVNYVHTDHLGSILAVTNSSMAYVARQNYDPWGRKRNCDTWTYSGVQTAPTWLYRGFTGHEEYPQFNLINMNARLYDPLVGRMLSPDIAVTMPYSTQGYNRYSYANNNPLKYIDPSGNEPITITILVIAAIKGAAIGVAMNGISNLIQGASFFDGWGQAAVMGGLAGGMSEAIGTIVGNMVGYTKFEIAVNQGLLHGWSGAILNLIQGGNGFKGFISGFASSITASSIQSLGGGKLSTILGGTVSGGIGSAVVGGNFYQGITFGLISTSLNHTAHEIVTKFRIDIELADAGINGSDVPEKNIESVKKVEELPSIKKLSTATKPNYVIKQEKCDVAGAINLETWDVELCSGAFRNYRMLASTVFHELNHLHHLVSGTYAKWANSRFEPAPATLRAYSELLAHSAELKYSGRGNPEAFINRPDLKELIRLYGNGN